MAVAAWFMLGNAQKPTTTLQWALLVWLGVVASGLGYFVWNYGATGWMPARGIMNNVHVPAGLLVNLPSGRGAAAPSFISGRW